jgi:molybdate transport system substrate-binding protein
VAIANPEGVCVGLYAIEIIEAFFSKDEKKQLRRNLINYTASCEKTATAISLRQADAVIGWRVFGYWDPMRIESISLPAHQIRRIGYLPIAIARSSRNPLEAARFIDYLTSAEGRAIFSKHHYFISPEEAFRYLGEKKPIGGQYKLPSAWKDPR